MEATRVTARILVVGGGGREHAIVWKLVQSRGVREVLCAPGNPGIESLAECVPVPVADLDGLVQLAVERAVNLVVVGPEDPLAAGLADRFDAAGIPVFGHTAAAARIESSKSWSKGMMAAAGIPTARSLVATDVDSARQAIVEIGGDGPVVIKADGLAAGKGVVVAGSRIEAEATLGTVFNEGATGGTLVIEECLTGAEVSILLLTDGESVRMLAPSCDHKRAFDGDVGPNTGGMGVYTPTARIDPALMARIEAEIVAPAVREMARRGSPLRGVLYPGLMLTPEGPKVIEFNCRFGDPETQVVLPTTVGDLGAWVMAVASGTLDTTPQPVSSGAAVGIALASGGYPGAYETGVPIHGLDTVASDPEVIVFHAGTRRAGSGEIVTAGGRVLTVVGLGPDLASAQAKAYEAADRITFQGKMMRSDIAARELNKR
ncbi:MAG: phosphoribosylamine--glycine ligase [Chloroflexia bacterium]|nr:phosphoribosylamine--glycine ligase [Chloroflexia bacterium]